MRVGVEAGAGATHPADEVDRGHAAATAARRGRPPATIARGMTSLIAAAAGLRSLTTYVVGEGGTSQRRWFGSFHTIQRRTHGKRSAAARANDANVAADRGGTLGPPPPFAQAGVPQSATTGSMPEPRSASSSMPSRSHSYVPCAASISRQSSVTRTAWVPSSRRLETRSSSVPGPNSSQASSVTPTFSPGAADVDAARGSRLASAHVRTARRATGRPYPPRAGAKPSSEHPYEPVRGGRPRSTRRPGRRASSRARSRSSRRRTSRSRRSRSRARSIR